MFFAWLWPPVAFAVAAGADAFARVGVAAAGADFALDVAPGAFTSVGTCVVVAAVGAFAAASAGSDPEGVTATDASVWVPLLLLLLLLRLPTL